MSPDELIKLYERMKADQSALHSIWRECSRMCLTRKLSSLTVRSASSLTVEGSILTEQDIQLLNTVAAEANATLASGLMSWIMPSEGNWFQWTPAEDQKGNTVLAEWLASCSEIALAVLRGTNFYSAAHEALLDRSTFGTAGLEALEGRRRAINFRTPDAGSFVIQEDDEGFVDYIAKEFELTARQAVDKFGEDKVPQVVKTDIASNKPDKKQRYLHVIAPREKARGTGPVTDMPIASYYLHLESKSLVDESGFEEMPMSVTRHLRWSSASAYGVSPAMQALAEMRGVNFLEMLVTSMGEVAVSPRLLLPQGYEGTPDLRAGGITMMGLGPDQAPKEWATLGKWTEGLQLIQRKEAAIREMFHASMFTALSQLGASATVDHVQAVRAEQLGRISPAFTLLTSELIDPTLSRIFMILYRAGRFPQPPEEALMLNALGEPGFTLPSVVQSNRMSHEMRAAKRGEFMNVFQAAAALAQGGMPALDNLDGDKITRDLFMDAGLNSMLKPIDARESERQARAKLQQAQQQAEMMLEAAKIPGAVDALSQS